MKDQYPALFVPGSIGKLRLKNRVIMSPVETLYASACGEVTPRLIEFYARRARGGVGLIVLHSVQGNCAIDTTDPYAGSLRLDNNAFIPMMSDLTEAVHAEGSKIAALVSIGGGARAAGEAYLTNGVQDGIPMRVAPSDVFDAEGHKIARMLTVEEIQATVEAYGRCAWRARAAGFDAFYIHALGSYLLAEFLSPLFNHREDAYGGGAQNRWRLLFELIESCQRQAGKDFPLVVRLSVDELDPQGRSLEESLRFLPLLERAGVAAVDITAGANDPLKRATPTIYVPWGSNLAIAKKVKEVMHIPVICTGKMHHFQNAEQILKDGIVDFISVAREFVADPDWLQKISSGKESQIRKCLNCNYCLGHRIMQRLPLRCAFNPYAGRETIESETPQLSAAPKKTVVIGGGPAGLEAARTLGLMGHQVELFEAGDTLCAGQIYTAQKPPCKESLGNIGRYYSAVLSGMENVHIHLRTPVDVQTAQKIGADIYYVATGAEPVRPCIPGIEQDNVFLAEDALLQRCTPGEKVVILGGGQVGAETAHLLSQQGKQVTVVEMLSGIAMQEEPLTRGALLYLLAENHVQTKLGKKVLAFEQNEVLLQDVASGCQERLGFDTALLAFGSRPKARLAQELKALGCKAVTIGDAEAVGSIATSIAQAHQAALHLERFVQEDSL